MTLSNRQRVGEALDLLTEGLRPYVERQFRRVYGGRWVVEAAAVTRRDLVESPDGKSAEGWDAKSLLDAMERRWSEVFSTSLGKYERGFIGILNELRNAWAHNEPFDTNRTIRVLDSVEELLKAVGSDKVADIQRQRSDLNRDRESEQRRNVTRRVSAAAIEGEVPANLQPWRELVTPHPDVVNRTFTQAEFAADLGQVARDEGSDEYRKPRDFFARTYITAGIHDLLINALKRINGLGGDPVVKLQTNFGGGKTHSMLALYHLVSGEPPAALPGLEPVLIEAGVHQLPEKVQRAVIAGQGYGPDIVRRKPDGTVVRTLWGELGWQLAGVRGYEIVAEADQAGTSPGSEALIELFRLAGPSLILIDEWITFIRQTWDRRDQPAGSFDANLTFAQALTEAARAVDNVLLVASLPASDVEVGGSAGRAALDRLEHTFARVEAVWRAATTEEGFGIVRRRLFEPLTDARRLAERDAVIRAFVDLYKANKAEFPSGCDASAYEDRMKAAYPIHPELFDRLFQDWSQLERFQRTRGVLRLMAKVIAELWESNDQSRLILPASVPIGDDEVRSELTRYLDDGWLPVIEKDVDGPLALPLAIDRERAGGFGRLSAARRVARTIYLGSAPLPDASNRGIDDRHIRLGVVQPGETIAYFGDALRQLGNRATYLYTDGARYWYARTPTVNRLAVERAAQLRPDIVYEEIRNRLRTAASSRGPFARVHAVPRTSSDVPDEEEARLVVLDPEHAHAGRNSDSAARAAAQEILDNRSGGPRLYRNMLVFLAADATRLVDLDLGIREYLAWQSIKEDTQALNLDPAQARLTTEKWEQAKQVADQRLGETYIWALSPNQEDPTGSVEWDDFKLQGQGTLTERVARRLVSADALVVETYGFAVLKQKLDEIPLWRGDDVSVRELWSFFAKYLYLPRLRDSSLLLQAIRQGVGRMLWFDESWAYAQRKDEAGRYHGLTYATDTSIAMDGFSLIVKGAVAQRQIEADAAVRAAATAGGSGPAPVAPYPVGDDDGGAIAPPPVEVREVAPRRFFGTVNIDPQRVSTSAGQIGQEIVQHLAGLVGANVRVTLEIEADIPDGAPEQVVRTVTENARTLRFTTYGFEKE